MSAEREAALVRLTDARRIGREWRTHCPVHDDEHPSLDFRAEGDRLLFCCRTGGCQSEDVFAAFRERYPEVFRNGGPSPERQRWAIRDESGAVVAVHVRYRGPGGKRYSWETPSGEPSRGEVKPARLPLYRLPELLAAKIAAEGDQPPLVVVTEGEKAADALARLGLDAVGSVTGSSGVPCDESLRPLLGCHVILWPDNDAAGRGHMRRMADRLLALGLPEADIGYIIWTSAPPKGDAADFKGTRDEVLRLVQPSLDDDPTGGFDPSRVVPVSTLVEEGRAILAEGVRYVVDAMVPDYGMLGFLVGYAKVGKSTLGVALVRAVSGSAGEFLGRAVSKRRVLYLALEDPREYLAWMMARSLAGTEDALAYPGSLVLDEPTLAGLETFVRREGVGLIYVSTFTAGVRGLVRDENDNAQLTGVVESLKGFTRRAGVPALLEAHSGKGEDQSPDADPVRALRGASAAAAAADFVLSLKRDGRGLTTRRVLSGGGRFVNFPPLAFDYDAQTGHVECLGSQKSAGAETTWRLIQEVGALSAEERSASAIAKAAGMTDNSGSRAMVRAALDDRHGVERITKYQGTKTVVYFRLSDEAVTDPGATKCPPLGFVGAKR